MAELTLQIVFDPATQKLSVTGPIDNKVLCYGMLEFARDIVRDFKPNGLQIVPADALPVKQNHGGS